MKRQGHEQIQRYVNEQADAAEAAALQAALITDAELRALYLDYVNLDVALSAAAEAITEHGSGVTAPAPRSSAPPSPHYGRWLAVAAAACLACVVFALLPGLRNPARTPADGAASWSSAHSAIERLTVEMPSLFPEWASPTAWMLEQPRIPSATQNQES